MAIKDSLQGAGNRVSSTAASARDNIRDGVSGAASRVRSVKIIDGLMDFAGSLLGAYRQVGQGIVNTNPAAKGLGGVKLLGRGAGSFLSTLSSMGGAGLKGLGHLVKDHPLVATVATLMLGGAYFKAWRNDRAAKQQMQEGQVPPPVQPQTTYYANATQAELSGPTGANVDRFAPKGPSLPGQSHSPANSGQPGQGF